MTFIKKLLIKYEYLFKRIGVACITLVLATILTFLLVRSMPGDVMDNYSQRLAMERKITIEEARLLAASLLDYNPEASLLSQFLDYTGGILKGNLGQSIYMDNLNANIVIQKTLPWTLFLSSISLLLSFLLGTAVGARMAWKRKGASDVAFSGYIVVSSSIPDYLVGMIILYVFAYTLKWFPTNGAYDIRYTPGFNLPFLLDCLYHGALPIAAYVFCQTGSWALMVKGSAVGTLGEDHINAARARGLPERVIVKKYLKKNAMLPLVTSLALSFAALFGGSPLMESIFNYPGIGNALNRYIGSRDLFLVQGLLLFISIVVVIANLIADSVYTLVDPRVRRNS